MRKFVLLCSVTFLSIIYTSADTNYVFMPLVANYPQISARPVTIMPFGNSITSSLPNNYSYRYFLWHSLLNAGFRDSVDIDFVGRNIGVFFDDAPRNPDFDQNHEGHPTLTSSELVNPLRQALQSNIPDIILIHVGTNDVQKSVHSSEVESNINRMIDSCRSYNPNMVILLARLVPSKNPSQDSVYKAVNDRISSITVKKHLTSSPIVLVDINSDFDPNLDIDQSDLVHLTTDGERKMASRWHQALCMVLPRMLNRPEAKKPIELFPRNGQFTGSQKIDIAGILRVNKTNISGYKIYVDGTERSGIARWSGLITEDSSSYRSFIMRDIWMRSTFGSGNHSLIFKFIFSDSTSVEDTARFTILNNR